MYSLSSMEEGYAHGEYTVQFGVYHITCVHNDRTKTNNKLNCLCLCKRILLQSYGYLRRTVYTVTDKYM